MIIICYDIMAAVFVHGIIARSEVGGDLVVGKINILPQSSLLLFKDRKRLRCARKKSYPEKNQSDSK
jgi:hypothetical protein